MCPLAARRATHPAARSCSPTLNRQILLDAVAHRRARIAELEDDLVAECEAAAVRLRTIAVRHDDAATWDRAAWDRYVARVVALEPVFGPRLRRLREEVARLDRLAALIPAG
jgi:hypothetical protein